MKLIAEITLVPIGVGVSLSPYVAACERVLRDAGLAVELHGNGTNVEGEWDDVMGAVRRCHELVHELGAPRVFTMLKLGTRVDRAQSLGDKVASVERALSAG
jgi:uncharacterized protein (TIGR00106 family)